MKKKIILLSVVALLASSNLSYAESNTSSTKTQPNLASPKVKPHTQDEKVGFRLYKMAMLQQCLGHNDKAIQLLTKAIQINPQVAYLYSRGDSYLALNNYKNAYNDFNKAIELYPECSKAYFSRAIFYSSLDINDKAISDLDNAIKYCFKKDRLEKYYQNRGYINFKLKRFDDAIEDYEQAIKYAQEYGNKKAVSLYTSYIQDIIYRKDFLNSLK